MSANSHEILVDETGPRSFTLAVLFDGRRFDCGTFVSRAEAMKAGHLFVSRKEGEAAARKKRPARQRR